MTEVDVVSRPDNVSQHDNDFIADEVQGEWELDELVQDLRVDWNQHDEKKNAVLKSLEKQTTKKEVPKEGTEFFRVDLSPVLEPIMQQSSPSVCATDEGNSLKTADSAKANSSAGPWSLSWLKKQPAVCIEADVPAAVPAENSFIFASEKIPSQPVQVNSKQKKGRRVKHSLGFMKKIARMPDVDRKQIIHILKKHKRNVKRRGQASNDHSQSIEVTTSNSSFNSANTKTSHSSVNKDLENWVMVHDKNVLSADVRNLGKSVGLEYQCDTFNCFNLLSKEGRREWRAAGGCEVVREVGEGPREV